MKYQQQNHVPVKLVLFDDINETLQIIEEIFGVKYTPNQNEITISINP